MKMVSAFSFQNKLLALMLCINEIKSLSTNYSSVLRKSKQFGLISIFHFPNAECTNTDGTLGECYTAQECLDRGGTSQSTCGNGIGVCCYIIQTSGAGSSNKVTLNNTYIRNAGYTDTTNEAGTYSHTITKISSEICQYRLDFETIELAQPASGVCTTDTLTMKEGGQEARTTTHHILPVYCGIGTGQHIYLQAHPNENVDATLDIVIGSGSTEARKWNIRVTQIECGRTWSPPANCQEYHTGISGTYNSWNYDGNSRTYVIQMAYSVCFRREKGYCGIGHINDGAIEVGTNTNGIGSERCVPDFIGIPQGSVTGYGLSIQRWCGAYWGVNEQPAPANFNGDQNLEVITRQTPFRTYVKSNPTNTRKGFKLNYRQILC